MATLIPAVHDPRIRKIKGPVTAYIVDSSLMNELKTWWPPAFDRYFKMGRHNWRLMSNPAGQTTKIEIGAALLDDIVAVLEECSKEIGESLEFILDPDYKTVMGARRARITRLATRLRTIRKKNA